eukprot:TRINITY_DN5656_c0_g1_i2.p1 TRINITY_DN5656_c0_g1~~TRINITY_DN5656_c0_g1_i2.p1  ORF type:complete len:319 (-),score=28.44 TRINITY_DN5656_c0_g1_i2:485-1441(-)
MTACMRTMDERFDQIMLLLEQIKVQYEHSVETHTANVSVGKQLPLPEPSSVGTCCSHYYIGDGCDDDAVDYLDDTFDVDWCEVKAKTNAQCITDYIRARCSGESAARCAAAARIPPRLIMLIDIELRQPGSPYGDLGHACSRFPVEWLELLERDNGAPESGSTSAPHGVTEVAPGRSVVPREFREAFPHELCDDHLAEGDAYEDAVPEHSANGRGDVVDGGIEGFGVKHLCSETPGCSDPLLKRPLRQGTRWADVDVAAPVVLSGDAEESIEHSGDAEESIDVEPWHAYRKCVFKSDSVAAPRKPRRRKKLSRLAKGC